MSALYDKALTAFGSAGINLLTDTIKVALLDSTYTVDLANHQYYSDLTGVVGTPVALTTPTLTGGVFDAADAVFTALAGNQVVSLVLYKDTGTTTTSPLIAYIDTGNGLPFTPNGQDLSITWDNGTYKIFKL